MLTMQTNITQLQTQQHQTIPNPIEPQLDPLNVPPVNPLPQINPLPNAILPQNQPDPMQDKLEKIESVIRKTGKIDGYLFNLKNICPYPDIRLPENFKFPDMDKFDGTGNPYHAPNLIIQRMRGLGKLIQFSY